LRLATRYTFEYIREAFEAGPGAALSALKSSFSLLANAPYIIPFSLSFFSRSKIVDEKIFSQINVPTVIIWGEDETVFGKSYSKNLEDKFENAKVATVPGMHNWINYHPEPLITHILD
jgi:pimeloyl-ACP methyl ester carboxylesterase